MDERVERPPWTYALWGGVGFLAGFGVVGILSIGIFLLAFALLLAIVGLAIPASRTPAALAALFTEDGARSSKQQAEAVRPGSEIQHA